ncbi:unnamed protein product [Pylaiella littoralis]
MFVVKKRVKAGRQTPTFCSLSAVVLDSSSRRGHFVPGGVGSSIVAELLLFFEVVIAFFLALGVATTRTSEIPSHHIYGTVFTQQQYDDGKKSFSNTPLSCMYRLIRE